MEILYLYKKQKIQSMKTIEIKTSQNVTIAYELANYWDRFLAFLIDFVIVFLFCYLMIWLLSVALPETWWIQNEQFAYTLIASVPVFLFLLYHFVSEALADGQTWGKKVMKIKVLRLDNSGSGLSDHLLRSLFYLVDWLFSFGILATLMINTSEKRQRLGDMTANTAVVKLISSYALQLNDILKISTLQDYEPLYPEVVNLSEEDLLLIKSSIARYHEQKNTAHQKVITELTLHLQKILDIREMPKDKIGFLKTLIKDYIVLTR